MSSCLRFVLLLLFITPVITSGASADSISITQAVISIFPNIGIGDNVSSSMAGGGTSISGGGGAGCGFCFVPTFGFLGGSLSASVDFIAPFGFLDTVQINGVTYDPNNVTFGSSFITSGTITFPGGSNVPPTFTITLPATFADVHGEIISSNQPLTLVIHPGELVLSFSLQPAGEGIPAYYTYTGGEFITTPEPGTVALLATGLLILAGRLRRDVVLPHSSRR